MKSHILGTITALYLGAAALVGGCDNGRTHRQDFNNSDAYEHDVLMNDYDRCYIMTIGNFDKIRGGFEEKHGIVKIDTCAPGSQSLQYTDVPKGDDLRKLGIDDLEKIAEDIKQKTGVRL